MLNLLRQRLAVHQPQSLATLNYPEAAVLLAITQETEPQLVFTRRASHLTTHRGQVAFPGGKRDPGDADLLTTALREAQEEINLPPQAVDILGSLGDVISLHGIRVTPFVGLIPPHLDLHPCEDELDCIFHVPLRWFLQDPRSHTDRIAVDSTTLHVPSYDWQGHRIWGLSAMMLVELLAVGLNQPLSLSQPSH